MGRGTSKVKPESLHITAKSGLADASGEMNLTMQTAVAGNTTLEEETAAVVLRLRQPSTTPCQNEQSRKK